MAEIYSVLITGASRGIGLGFVKEFLTNNSVRTDIIIAACRSPQEASALQELKKSNDNLHILKLDVNQFDTYDEVVNEVESIVGDRGLTLLINNAGIGVFFLHRLEDVTPEEFISLITTNGIAPVLLTKALYPLLKRSSQVHSTKIKGLSVMRAAVMNITSEAGSISRNSGILNLYGYRESKTALNMSTKSLAIDLEDDGILVESFHPGNVRTELVAGPGVSAGELSPSDSAAGMISVMIRLTEKNHNGFYNWKGDVLSF